TSSKWERSSPECALRYCVAWKLSLSEPSFEIVRHRLRIDEWSHIRQQTVICVFLRSCSGRYEYIGCIATSKQDAYFIVIISTRCHVLDIKGDIEFLFNRLLYEIILWQRAAGGSRDEPPHVQLLFL